MNRLRRWGCVLPTVAVHPSCLGACWRAASRPLELRTAYEHVRVRYELPDGLPTVDIHELCPGLNEVVRPYASLESASPPVDIALLRALARSFRSCRYFEIGSWRGESLANVAEVAEHCVSLSLGRDGVRRLLAVDLLGGRQQPAAMADQMHAYSRDLANVDILVGDSQRFDFRPYRRSFDMVYVDAYHGYEAVLADSRSAFSLLRGPESIIVWHDYATSPEFVS